MDMAYLYTMIECEARHQNHDGGEKDQRYGYGPQVLDVVVLSDLVHKLPESGLGYLPTVSYES